MKRSTDSDVLKSIRDNNMIFVSAQPDTTYFHWQVEIYLYQFAKHGISDRCYALFGCTGSNPSTYAKELAKKFPNIKFYKDTREQNEYSPSIRPHLLAKFFKEYPKLGKNVFYHDSDIFLTKLPRFDLMLTSDSSDDINDNASYVSNTISYIGYEYLKDCSTRYRNKYPFLPELNIFYGMCKVVGIKPQIVIDNQNNSGGAQYLLKNIDYMFWKKCEKKCVELYTYLADYEKRYPIDDHIQKWTTDMWVILWLYWKRIGITLIHKELDFSWATSTIKEYNKLNIFHLAGITDDNCADKFYKGKFTKQTVFTAYIKNPNIFSHIDKNNATYLYTEVIKEYVKQSDPHTILQNNNIKRIMPKKSDVRFKINADADYNGIYGQDSNVQCCNKYIWRSENNSHIIFWNGAQWILTYSMYENRIGSECGGIISNTSSKPYHGSWNGDKTKITMFKI